MDGCVGPIKGSASPHRSRLAELGQRRRRRTNAQQKVGYFAYGSNMFLPRLQQLAKSARPVKAISIRGYVIKFNKLGDDGSAKCNIVHTGKDEDTVAGVVFEMTVEDMAKLDSVKEGYERIVLTLNGPNGQVSLLTYVATGEKTAEGIQPFTSYKNHVLVGAKMFKLPQAYIDSVIVPVKAKEAPAPTE